jgi:hypothetical protein
MTHLSKAEYVMGKLLYFLGRFSPQARQEFMRRALLEVAKRPGGYGEEFDVRPPAPGPRLPALPAPAAPGRRRRISKGRGDSS